MLGLEQYYPLIVICYGEKLTIITIVACECVPQIKYVGSLKILLVLLI